MDQDSRYSLKIYLLFICVLQVKGSLLSRMKNPYEYLPFTKIDMIDRETNEDYEYVHTNLSYKNTLPTSMFNDLGQLNERNQTRRNESLSLTRVTNKRNYQKRRLSSKAEYYYDDEHKWPLLKLFMSTTSPRFMPTALPTRTMRKITRTWPSYFPPKFISKLQAELDDALLPWKLTTPASSNMSMDLVANLSDQFRSMPQMRDTKLETACYMCGLDQSGIPLSTLCYTAFESEDERYRKMRRRFKVKCIKDTNTRRIKNNHYSPDYRGGCFKRFLDIGIEYNERGCRTKEPTKGKSYASHRLASLEKILSHTDEGCVFSPFASLTPFSRAVSLYVRYHVCVCRDNYCNRAANVLHSKLNKIILIAFCMKQININ